MNKRNFLKSIAGLSILGLTSPLSVFSKEDEKLDFAGYKNISYNWCDRRTVNGQIIHRFGNDRGEFVHFEVFYTKVMENEPIYHNIGFGLVSKKGIYSTYVGFRQLSHVVLLGRVVYWKNLKRIRLDILK